MHLVILSGAPSNMFNFVFDHHMSLSTTPSKANPYKSKNQQLLRTQRGPYPRGKVLISMGGENKFDVITWIEEKEKSQNRHTWNGRRICCLQFGGRKNSTAIFLHWSTTPNPQYPAAMEFMSMSVPEITSTVVGTGILSGTGSLLSWTANPGLLSSKKSSRVILCPAMTPRRRNCLSSEFSLPPSSRSRSVAALLSLLHQMGASKKLSGGTSSVMVKFWEDT